MGEFIARATVDGETKTATFADEKSADAAARNAERNIWSARTEVYARSQTIGALREYLNSLPAEMDEWPVEYDHAGYGGTLDVSSFDLDTEYRVLSVLDA